MAATLVAAVLGLAPAVAAADEPTAAPDRARVAAAYGQTPLAFEANRGQYAGPADFLARGDGYALWLTSTEAVFALRAGGATGAAAPATVRMQLVGGDAGARSVGERRLPGLVNHYPSNDPARWRTASTFGAVRYGAVYDGIDVVYYGHQGALEYDFVVAPGADPRQIGLRFSGVDGARVAADGALVLAVGGQTLRWEAPVLYQTIAGERRAVAGRYTLTPGRAGKGGAVAAPTVGFAVGAYDATAPLVIDPVLTYSTFLGGSQNDRGDAITVNTAGQAWVTGYTMSPNFPVAGGPIDASFNGGLDVFVTKLNAAGSGLLYSTFLGSVANDDGTGIALDSFGNVYVTGRTSSPAFPVTAGAYDVVHNGSLDGFVVKLNPAGGLVYSTFVGSPGNDEPTDIAVDDSGRAYIVGHTTDPGYPVTAGAFDVGYNGGANDVFVTRLNPAGTALDYSTFLGGTAFDFGNGIVLEGNEAIVTGRTTSFGFPVVAGCFDVVYNGGNDVFVTRLSPAGNALLASTFVGGAADESGEDIARGPQGHFFITGWGNVGYPTTAGAYDVTQNGGTDVIVTKLNPTLTALTYSTFVGTTANEYGYGIAVNISGGAIVVGMTPSAAFPSVAATQAAYGGGVYDAFVLRVVPTGAALNFSTFLGGTGTDQAQAVVLDASGNPYLTGSTDNNTFPTVAGSFDVVQNGAIDAFVSKYTM